MSVGILLQVLTQASPVVEYVAASSGEEDELNNMVAQNNDGAVTSKDVIVPVSADNETKDTSDESITEVVMVKTEVEAETEPAVEKTPSKENIENTDVFSVPFFSQFSDITAASWKKIGCGIASLAMLIEFYEPGEVTVDNLLAEGISDGAYISDAGWSHAGLISLSKKHGLSGSSRDMAGSSMESAFDQLEEVLEVGPVMVSVHYTFDPKNPIPHLVVVNGVKDGLVYYNDPAEDSGGGTVSVSKFQNSWKKRYISIRPNA